MGGGNAVKFLIVQEKFCTKDGLKTVKLFAYYEIGAEHRFVAGFLFREIESNMRDSLDCGV